MQNEKKAAIKRLTNRVQGYKGHQGPGTGIRGTPADPTADKGHKAYTDKATGIQGFKGYVDGLCVQD